MNTTMNPMLGQVLGGLFGQALRRRSMGGGMAAGLPGGPARAPGGLGGLGGVLGGALGGKRGALLMLLLPYAMRWVQQQGGIGAVLKRFQQQGYGRQSQSWVDLGANQPVDGQAVEQVMGREEIAQVARQLGLPEQEVTQGLAEIMPEMVDQLTPQGQLEPQSDEVLADGYAELERELGVQRNSPPR